MSADAQPVLPDLSSRSRENALQHGFTGEGVVLPQGMRLEVDERRRAYIDRYQPQTLHDFDLVHRAALGVVRFNHLQPMFARRAAQRARLAASHWPLLRSLEAAERAKRLTYDPPGVVARLKTNLGGVEFLLNEWKLLQLAADSAQGWTPKQIERAQNLAGVPRIHRHLDPHKIREGSPEERKALADRHVAELERLLHDQEIARLDEEERRGIVRQLDDFDDPVFDRLLRYEQRALRMHQGAIRELNEGLESRGLEPVPPELGDRPPSRRLIRTDSDDPGVEPVAEEPTPPGVPMGQTKIVPPFGRNYTREQYLAKITDPDCIARFPVEELPPADSLVWTRLANWLEANRLKLDLTTSMRGLLGHVRRIGEQAGDEFSGQDQDQGQERPQPADRPGRDDAARLLKEARKRAEQDRKAKRKAQARQRRR
ncbi:MAG: hypothetical protein U0800_25530 [Isosphaeraceae bacterium]